MKHPSGTAVTPVSAIHNNHSWKKEEKGDGKNSEIGIFSPFFEGIIDGYLSRPKSQLRKYSIFTLQLMQPAGTRMTCRLIHSGSY